MRTTTAQTFELPDQMASNGAVIRLAEHVDDRSSRLCPGFYQTVVRETALSIVSLKQTPNAPPHSAIDWSDVVTQRMRYERGHVIFAQGDPAATVMYVEDGAVRMSVLSHNGKEAVIAMLEAGHFFGEPCLAGHSKRIATATTIGPSTLRAIPKDEMIRHLHLKPALADHFIAHMVQRNIRIEQDFVDQMFNSSEKRLARTLLLLARSGKRERA